MRALLNLGVAASCCAAVSLAGVRVPAQAAAAEQNRAVLVVDTGEQVKKVCVRFSEEVISGAELLQRADVQAGLRPYAGKGVAVCSLCGTGCRADDSCLTCDPDGRYWAYSRAPAGTSSFRLSPAGASNTEVRNGDVEGWRWSRGSSPPYVTVAEVCDGAAPAATTATTAPASTATTAGGQAPTVRVAPTEPNSRPPSPTAPSTAPAPTGRFQPTSETRPAAAPSSTSSPTSPGTLTPSDAGAPAPPSAPTPTTDADALAPRASAQTDEGGSPAGLLALAGLVAGLLGWAAWARRRRRLT